MCKVDGCERQTRLRRGYCGKHYSRLLRHGTANGITRLPPGTARAFLESIAGTTSDECIPWPYKQDGRGYGQTKINGKVAGAHRASLVLATGEDPEGMHAAHFCGNSICVNPKHLRWATPAQNIQDNVERGTNPKGVRIGKKLRALHVRLIAEDPRPNSKIAAEYGVSRRTIGFIKSGETWSWLTGIKPKREKVQT